MKRERIEDLGVINAKLQFLIENFEESNPYFDSKHSYESFEKYLEKDDSKLDLHMNIRHLLEELWSIWAIARGEDE